MGLVHRVLYPFKTTQACRCSPSPVASFLHWGNQACTGIYAAQFGITRSRKQIDQIEAIQRRALRIIYSYTKEMPYINAFYCAAILSLAVCEAENGRRAKPQDPSITTRLISANKFTRLRCRSRKYQIFISYALAHYQTA